MFIYNKIINAYMYELLKYVVNCFYGH